MICQSCALHLRGTCAVEQDVSSETNSVLGKDWINRLLNMNNNFNTRSKPNQVNGYKSS